MALSNFILRQRLKKKDDRKYCILFSGCLVSETFLRNSPRLVSNNVNFDHILVACAQHVLIVDNIQILFPGDSLLA